jgi:hypothetical protein
MTTLNVVERKQISHSDPSCQAIHDLTSHASNINVPENANTKYYAIAGECLPFLYYPPLDVTLFLNLMMDMLRYRVRYQTLIAWVFLRIVITIC